MKAIGLLKEDVMFAAILNGVQKNGVIRATSVSTASKISTPYRRFDVISRKPVKLDQK